MRIKLSNSKSFFDEILVLKEKNIKQLALELKTNYSNLKQYRRGVKLLPKQIFDRLVKISPRKEFWLEDYEKFEDNWGKIKGGENAAKSPRIFIKTAYARSFRKIKKIDIKMNTSFCEFYGALLGDGCLCKFKDKDNKTRYIIQFSGNKKLDSEYVKYLADILKRDYDLSSYYYEPRFQNVCTLSIKSKNFFLTLNKKFKVPIGLKYAKLKLSSKLLKLHWDIKKYILRGLFDTDGCILANKREDYRYPWISISSKSESFREEIKTLLKEQGYPAYITGSDVCVRGIRNVKRWFSDIGSSNKRNIYKYKYFLKTGYLPARLL